MVRQILRTKTRATQILFVTFLFMVFFCISELYGLLREATTSYETLQLLTQNISARSAQLCKDSSSFPQVIQNYLALSTEPPIRRRPKCVDLLEGEESAQRMAKSFMSFYPPSIPSEDQLLHDLKNCDMFIAKRGYSRQPGSGEERDFPIAYSIMIHTDIGQAERLLRTIYQPQNQYCFHVDAKADSKISAIIVALSKCLPNVFLVSKQVSVVYASIKRLEAELNCLKDLISKTTPKKWKYFINLTGQAFPLKTNLELVKIFKIYNGANDIEGMPTSTVNRTYITKRWKFKWVVLRGRMAITSTPKEPPPNDIKLVKGSAYGIFSRKFVEFALTDPLSKTFLEWCKDTYSPDEFYWATLHHILVNPMFMSPGGFSGAPERKPWLASYSAWHPVEKCAGKFIRSVCIFGVGDLPNLLSRNELFANKFYWNYEYLALDCVEEWLQNKTKHHLPSDLFYYKQLPFIQS